VSQVADGGQVPECGFSSRLPHRLDERRAFRERGDPEDHPGNKKVADEVAVDQIVDRQPYGETAADQERRDGREKRPAKARPP
jgi:hypothetical protein